ncbi:MAG: lytic transglycosylase domain-containing protein [Caulobacteraceae bacterium]
MTLGFARGSASALVFVAAASLAAAQGLSSDSPAPVTGAAVSPAQGYYRQPSPQSDAQSVTTALAAARVGDGAKVRAAMTAIVDPIAREIALWALVDGAPDSLSFQEADAARRELADWPRPARREAAAEKLLDRSGLSPAAVIAWFGGEEPRTGPGALALATALRATGDAAGAAAVARKAWRTLVFDEDQQEIWLARFSAVLTQADHVAREDMLLYGAQGVATQDLLRLLPPDQQAIAVARMAVRRGDPNAQSLIDALPPAAQTSPGLAYERVLRYRNAGQTDAALALIGYLPAEIPNEAAATRLWKHGALVSAAMKAGDYRGAYAAAAHSGLSSGSDAAEAEFAAGWIALARLKDPRGADEHFAKLQGAGQSPLTQSRAFYWRGRAAEAIGDPVAAQLFFGQAARFDTTFYGQLAASRGGKSIMTLGGDPPIGDAQRTRFNARDSTRAARYLYQIGGRDAFRGFVAGLSETAPDAVGEALLVDLARNYGEQEIAMRVVRNAARRGFILPERGYPIRIPPTVPGAPEPAFILGITRQESSFDPAARSGAGARGMMQLMPATAQVTARRFGLGYGSLDDADYNMRVGSAYLGELVDQFSGSYVMAAAAYNAGPGRPIQWAAVCGDPRSSSVDPVDFIECIPFSETRDYVMRVLEAMQVYRARLHGGSAPITLANDLKRGAYGYAAAPAGARYVTPAPVTTP